MSAAKKEEKKPVMSCASSGHITKLKQSIFGLSISMITMHDAMFVRNSKEVQEIFKHKKLITNLNEFRKNFYKSS